MRLTRLQVSVVPGREIDHAVVVVVVVDGRERGVAVAGEVVGPGASLEGALASRGYIKKRSNNITL